MVKPHFQNRQRASRTLRAHAALSNRAALRAVEEDDQTGAARARIR